MNHITHDRAFRTYGQDQPLGERTREAVRYVAANPGCTKAEVAAHVGPRGNISYGVRTVNRAEARKLITVTYVRANLTSLKVTAAGRKVIK